MENKINITHLLFSSGSTAKENKIAQKVRLTYCLHFLHLLPNIRLRDIL